VESIPGLHKSLKYWLVRTVTQVKVLHGSVLCQSLYEQLLLKYTLTTKYRDFGICTVLDEQNRVSAENAHARANSHVAFSTCSVPSQVHIFRRHLFKLWIQTQSTYIYRVQSSVWRLPNYCELLTPH
jgi:hypothetical protein